FVGPAEKSAAPVVLKALGDPAPQVRRKAAFALRRVDPDPEAVVGPLVAALADKDGDVGQAVGAALTTFGKAAVPALVKAMQSDQADQCNRAIKALGDIGPAAEIAVPELAKLMHEPAKDTAETAATALAGI